ncbi:MAG TPA: hypothetical protein DCQ06_06980 [Myxococcales bacterium]|nr:hypothetical protein [Myxococcales bacterium]
MSVRPTRECPVCGMATKAMFCPKDGAQTRETSQEKVLPLAIGDLVDSRYRIDGVLGGGGFSVVYKAANIHTDQTVAIKVMRLRESDDLDVFDKRFQKEVQILGRLLSPTTVRVFDAGLTENGCNYLVMELIAGPNFKQLMSLTAKIGQALTECQVIDIIAPILESLAEAHDLGLVHRDLKPANIMLTTSDDSPLVSKLVDFGVARTENSDLTSQRTSVGTPRYMSPEQCRGEPVDARSDIYSVGCVLFEALTGTPPFQSRNHVDTMWQQVTAPIPDAQDRVRHQLSPEIRSVLRLSMAKEPEKRFASATAMGRALRRIRETRWEAAPRTDLRDLLRGHEAADWRSVKFTQITVDNTQDDGEVVDGKDQQFADTVSVDLNDPIELVGSDSAPTEGALSALMAVAEAQAISDDLIGANTVDFQLSVALVDVVEHDDLTPSAWSATAVAPYLKAADEKLKKSAIKASPKKTSNTWAKGTLVGTGVPASVPVSDEKADSEGDSEA